ncbi:MAG: TM2 domain-containing protein [Candidatus Dormibacteria bacterium]
MTSAGPPTPPQWPPPGPGGPPGQLPGYTGPPVYGAPPPGYGGPPGYPPPYGYPGPDPRAPYGWDPRSGLPYSDKSKLAAFLLEFFLGAFGAGRWYLGYPGVALAQLLTCGGLGIWALIDSILMVTGNVPDRYGRPLRD